MTQRIQANRFDDTLDRPPNTRPPGELFVNYPDMAFGVSSTGASLDLLPIRFHSSLAQYATNDLVVSGGNLWQAKSTIPPRDFTPADWNQFLPAAQATVVYDDRYLRLAGGTLTGPLVLAGDPTGPLNPVTRQYLDARLGAYLPLTGGILTGQLTVPLAGIRYSTSGGFWDHGVAFGWDGTLHAAIDGTYIGAFYTAGTQDARFLKLTGGTVSGQLTVDQYGDFTNSGAAALIVQNANEAVLAFHRPGQYAIKIGLDAANRFNIGGWSAPYGRLILDMAGNLTVPGNYAGNYITTSTGANLNGATSVGGTLTVAGAATLNSTLAVAGDGTVNGNVWCPHWISAGEDLKTGWGVSYQGQQPIGIWWDGSKFNTDVNRGDRSYNLIESFSSSADNRVVKFTVNNSGYGAAFIGDSGGTLVGWPVSISDRRFKFNIAPCEVDALDIVRRTPVHTADLTYPWDESHTLHHLACTFLADEVETTVPSAVSAMDDETALLMLNPLHLLAMLWRAVQQLEARHAP